LTDDERRELRIEKLPASLEESLNAFENSNFIKKTLGKELVKIYLDLKYSELQEFEIAKSNGNDKQWEYDKYLFW
jgi:glutamine synthetase